MAAIPDFKGFSKERLDEVVDTVNASCQMQKQGPLANAPSKEKFGIIKKKLRLSYRTFVKKKKKLAKKPWN